MGKKKSLSEKGKTFQASDQLARIGIRQRRITVLKLIRVPIGNGGNVILQGQISPILSPAERLDRHTQILLEIDRIGDVPTV